MLHPITIVLRADAGRDSLSLEITGCLTRATRGTLALRIAQARVLDPSVPVFVDAREARHVDPIALQLLRSSVDNAPTVDASGHRLAPVRFLIPAPLPRCPLDSAPSLGDLL